MPMSIFKSIEYLFILLALIAEVMGTLGGFGSSVFFVPIANFYFDFQSVLGLTALFHVASNLSKIALFRKGLDKQLLLYIGAPSVIFVIIGGVLSKYANSTFLEVSLGIFLVVLSLVFIIKKNLVINPERIPSVVGGSLSGFAAGLLGTGGAIRGITMAAFNLEKSVFIATSAAIDFFIDSTRTVVYFFNGYINSHILIYIPFLILVGILGTYIGKQLLVHVTQTRFKLFSLLLIFFIGMVTIAKVMLQTI